MTSIIRLNPLSLVDGPRFGFSHATVQHAGATLHIAGQIAWDGKADLVGAQDLALQTRQVLSNLLTVLHAGGCSPADIVHLRIYVVDTTPAKFRLVAQEIAFFYGGTVPAPSTYLGVAGLALPEFLIEIDATAAIPAPGPR